MKKFVTGAAVLVAAVGSVLVSAPPAHAASNYYGAIAVSSSTGRYGYSYDYPSYAAAEGRALSGCGAGDCKVLVSWRNGCGALAYSSKYWSAGAASTLPAARSKALAANPYSAVIEHWNCTTGYTL
ncbi:DUF4189 domain-containing protein [Nocardia sp. NPDC052566]|uniref:DUF4189 domain-containing protein n=1 Tax=Nocardia sp. NPDC052566 TaxID=3364330 RepID=UPI0037CB217E